MAPLSIQRRLHEYRRIASDRTLLIGLLITAAFLALTILWPLVKILSSGFSAEALPTFTRYLTSPVYLGIIGNTIWLGVLVGVLGTALGFLFAFVEVRVAVPCKRFMRWMALLPIVSPPFAVATALITLFGRSGLITYQILGIRYNIYGLTGLTVALVLALFTVAYVNLSGMMRALNPVLDEAATNLGATKWDIFRTVTLPMLIPGIAGSFLLLFVEAIADLANPLVLGGDFTVLASRIYIAITGEYDVVAGAVLSIILLVPTLTVFILHRYWVNRRSVVSVTGKPAGTPQLITRPAVKWPLFALTMFFALFILLIYGTVVIGAFTQLLGINNAFTLEHFQFVLFGYGSEAITDTSWLSAIATPIAGLLGMLIAWLVVRKQFTGREGLDFVAMLGIAVPGAVLGIGFVLAFHNPIKLGGVTVFPALHGGGALLGGAVAIVLAFIVRSVPAGLRAAASALQQIDPAIEEASVSLGADSAITFRKVTLPLIRPALFASLVFSFARSMTSISAIIFLTTPETKIMTAQILNEVDAGRFGNAFAYCVILIVIETIVIGVLSATVGTTTAANREIASIS